MSPSLTIPSRKVTNEDFRDLDKFFTSPHPLYAVTWEALWSPDWLERHRAITALLGVPFAYPWTPDYYSSGARYGALQHYLKQWAPCSLVSISVESVRFDQFRLIRISTPATREYFENHLGDDPMLAQITMYENIVLALALAWRVTLGDADFSLDGLAPR